MTVLLAPSGITFGSSGINFGSDDSTLAHGQCSKQGVIFFTRANILSPDPTVVQLKQNGQSLQPKVLLFSGKKHCHLEQKALSFGAKTTAILLQKYCHFAEDVVAELTKIFEKKVNPEVLV